MRDVDEIIRLVRTICPAVGVQQLRVSHPGADDDGIWFFELPDCEFEVQIASSQGMCPFVIETDENDVRITATSIEDTVQAVTSLLHLR